MISTKTDYITQALCSITASLQKQIKVALLVFAFTLLVNSFKFFQRVVSPKRSKEHQSDNGTGKEITTSVTPVNSPKLHEWKKMNE